jgi:hypothetical protein
MEELHWETRMRRKNGGGHFFKGSVVDARAFHGMTVCSEHSVSSLAELRIVVVAVYSGSV